MSVQQVKLTDAEWQVMECLWAGAPMSGREVTQALEPKTGWSRSTILTLLSRLEAKGAVAGDSQGGKKCFLPLLRREDAALQETETFLDKVYHGSLSLMVSALTQRQALSPEEIHQLHQLLDGLEGGNRP